MKKLLFVAFAVVTSLSAIAQSKVYMTLEITPEALIKIYQALGRFADGQRVSVKTSTGDAGNPNYLKPALIQALVDTMRGTIVECNTAYTFQYGRYKMQKVIASDRTNGIP